MKKIIQLSSIKSVVASAIASCILIMREPLSQSRGDSGLNSGEKS